MPSVRQELLSYYDQELRYLRHMSVKFAETYPGLAPGFTASLKDPDRGVDPHVDRLMEGFALLAARIHLKLDDDFPQISSAILEALYPHYTRPVPSMAVVQFELDENQGKLSTGLTIPKGSPVKSSVSGVPCRFRTGYETTMWPVAVTAARWLSGEAADVASWARKGAAALQLSLECSPDVVFDAKLKLRSLRFYLHGDSNVISTLYELLFNNCLGIRITDPDSKTNRTGIELPSTFLKPVGFEANEGVLPYDRRSFIGYRLLQEYFSFPEKFFFVDLCGLEELEGVGFGRHAKIEFAISRFEHWEERHPILERGVSKETLRLGCAPIVNLFSQYAKPIPIDNTKFEYEVIPDDRHETTTEIFSIDSVTTQDRVSQKTISFQPFYSFRHAAAVSTKPLFWHTKREKSELSNSLPTRVFIALVDLAGNPAKLDSDVLSLQCTCTNSDLPRSLRITEASFQLEGFAAIGKISALSNPTQALRPPLGKATLWNLVSQLSLNYLSLVAEGKEALQEILRLYNFSDLPHLNKQIDGINKVNSSRQFGLVNSENGVSPARGTRVEIELNEDQFAGAGVYLFASVLERFLGLYVSMNSFSQLVASTSLRKEVLREWPPRAGSSILL